MWKLSGHFVQVVLLSAERRGLDRDKVLAATGLPLPLMKSSIQPMTDQEFFSEVHHVYSLLESDLNIELADESDGEVVMTMS